MKVTVETNFKREISQKVRIGRISKVPYVQTSDGSWWFNLETRKILNENEINFDSSPVEIGTKIILEVTE